MLFYIQQPGKASFRTRHLNKELSVGGKPVKRTPGGGKNKSTSLKQKHAYVYSWKSKEVCQKQKETSGGNR